MIYNDSFAEIIAFNFIYKITFNYSDFGDTDIMWVGVTPIHKNDQYNFKNSVSYSFLVA